jgi:hypothetical protein
MVPMRTPDEDGGFDETREPLGDGFASSADDLTDGFGEDDFSDDAHASVGEDESADDDDEDDEAGAQFGDGLSDDEAKNVLVEILDDVFGEDAPEVVRDLEATTGLDPSELVDALGDTSALYAATDPLSPDYATLNGLDAPDEGYDDTDLPTKEDFDLTHDGQVDHQDLHEATHPFDFHAG